MMALLQLEWVGSASKPCRGAPAPPAVQARRNARKQEGLGVPHLPAPSLKALFLSLEVEYDDCRSRRPTQDGGEPL